MTSQINSTTSKIETAPLPITDIKKILNNIHVPVVNSSPEEAIRLKEQYKASLNEAYGLAHDLPLLAEIMTKFGRLRYEENYPSCMVMMRASLNAQLASIGIVDKFEIEKYDQLSKLEESLFRHEKFSAFDDFILNSDMNAIASAIHKKNLSSESLTLLGYTLSWFTNGLYHTKEYTPKEPDGVNNIRFEQIYRLCEQILVMANDEKATLELAELYYNGFRGAEFRKDPKNIRGAHEWLDKAVVLNPSKEMKARVANLKSCDYAESGDLQKAKELLDEAIAIRQSYPKEEQNPFLVANLHSRKAGFLLKVGKFEEADRVIDSAIEYSTACRGSRDPVTDNLIDQTHDHQYFGIYDWKKAQIKLALGELSEALKYINRALETYKHHEQDSEEEIKMANDVKAQIIKLLSE